MATLSDHTLHLQEQELKMLRQVLSYYILLLNVQEGIYLREKGKLSATEDLPEDKRFNPNPEFKSILEALDIDWRSDEGLVWKY